MKYLLDVNVLVALGFRSHQFDSRANDWVRSLDVSSSLEMLTCAITELGFIRVLVQTPLYNVDLLSARTLLIKLKGSETLRFTFVSDDQDVSLLPSWVTTSKQITDGHLMQLAESKGAIFSPPSICEYPVRI